MLPKDIDIVRPGASINLKDNTRRLTTPFDIHATFLDILGLNRNENYNIHSKILPRSLSLFGQVSLKKNQLDNNVIMNASIFLF